MKMNLTSAEASKLLKKLGEELKELEREEEMKRTFLAAVGEDVESVRPDYDYEECEKKQAEIKEKIRKLKHCINVFNVTTVVPELGMTIDEALVYIPQLNERLFALAIMKSQLPKERQSIAGKSSATVSTWYNFIMDVIKYEKPKVIFFPDICRRSHAVSGDFAARMKEIAMENKVLTVVECGMRRNIENMTNKRPAKMFLAADGEAKKCADEVFFVYRGAYYGENEDFNTMEIFTESQKSFIDLEDGKYHTR